MVQIRTLERKYLNTGNRYVERFSNGIIIKWGCPKTSRSGGQNRAEAEAWESVKHIPGIDKIVVPVLDYALDGTWLMMPEVRVMEDVYYTWEREQRDEFYTHDGPLNQLKAKVRAVGLDTNDLHMGNLGQLRDGSVVVLDYGYKLMGKNAFRADDNMPFDKLPRCTATCYWAKKRNMLGVGIHPEA